jgi:PAS domain S-box-containing protein
MKRTVKPKKELTEKIKKPMTRLEKAEKRRRGNRADESEATGKSDPQGSERLGGYIERGEAERRLLESNERMVNILESISDGFFSLDNQMVVTFYNRAAEHLLGRARAHVLGKKLSDAFPEAKGSIFERNYAEAIRDKKPMTFEVHFNVKPFENWYQVRVFPFKDGISVYFQVTTERKEVERKLAHLASFPELNPNPVVEVSSDGCVHYLNPAAQKLFPDLQEMGRRHEWLADLNTIGSLSKDKEKTFYVREIHTNGVWFEQFFSFVHEQDRIRIYGRDITERKRAEQALEAARTKAVQEKNRLETVMEALSVGVSILDAQGGIIQCNSTFETIWGDPRPTARTVSDYAAYKAWWADTGKPVQPDEWASARAVQKGETVIGQLMEIERFDGTRRFVMNSGAPIRNADNDIVGSAVVIQDITGQKQAEEALKKARERFELLSETASRLLATDKPQEILNELCQKVMAHLDCHAFFNYLVDEGKECLHLNAYSGIPEETAKEIEWLEYGVAVCGCAARDASRIVCENIPTTPDPRTELVKSLGIKAYACHPLLSAGRVIGTLSFGTQSKLGFTQDELALMKTVADQVAVKMEHMRLIEALRKSRDELEIRVQERTAELSTAYQKLKEQSKILEAFFSSTVTPLVFLDRNFNYVRVNDAYAKACQREVSEFLGHNYFKFYPSGAKKQFEQVVETRKPCQAVARPFIFPDHPEWGTSYWDWTLTPILDDTGEVEFLVFSSEDVTARKRAQDTVEAERRRFNDVMEILPAYLVLLTPDYHVRFANRFFRERFGESHGRRCFEYLFGRSEPCEPCESYTPLKTQASHKWDWTGPDGRSYHVFDFPFTDTDGSAVILEMGIDVTERMQAEEALKTSSLYARSLIEASLDPLVTISADGKVTDVNRATELVTGVSRENLIGSDFSTYFTEPEKARVGYETVFSKGSVRDYPLAIRHMSGAITDVLYNATIYKNEAGQVQGVFAAARDITEQKKAEKALKGAEERLRQMQKMEALGTLAGGIAHDFNNILMPIVINTELALFDVPSETPVAKSLQIVLNAANRGKEMVKQITTFSRMKEQERKPIKIAAVVKEALAFLKSSFPKHIEIQDEIKAESSMVASDPTQIHQVLMNLCGNAADAMREKGGLLRVTLEEIAINESMVFLEPGLKVGPYVQLTVSDTGTGMPPDVMEKVFDPFFTTKDPVGGTGMGLAVVHGIVKNHSGVVRVSSEVGKGSVFTVYLPRVKADSVKDSSDESPIAIGNETILVVDDEEYQVQSMRDMLERLGYRVSGTTRSLEALELFRKQPGYFDLVITDEVMPGITGSKLAEELLKIRPDLPIILSTGYSETINRDKAREIGIRELMMKPFGVREVSAAIRRVLKR